MHIEQIYTNCLAEASYYIESNGEVAIIDPIRETEPYTSRARERNAKIKYVFETHFHADFISGHIDLANKTGAKIIFGPKANTEYEIISAKDGQEFQLGNVKIKVLHTPGHTPESSSFLLIDSEGKNHAVFTGDTLFVGDVSRPDLLDGIMTKEELSGMLYDSLNSKIKPLADDVIVYPGHGPGSSCGKNIGTETWSTIGIQRKTNYAMQDMTKEAFIAVVTDGLLPPPAYFFASAKINKQGYQDIETVLERNVKPLSVAEAKAKMDAGAIVVDTRNAEQFANEFIPGSINIGLDGSFALWVGAILDPKGQFIVLAEEGREKEAVLRMARVGYENIPGYLSGGIAAWKATGLNTGKIENISATDFYNLNKSEKLNVLDVRKVSEYSNCHLMDAKNIPLADLSKNLDKIDANEKLYVHCAGGYRSMIAASLIWSSGKHDVVNIEGGFGRMKETPIEIVKEWETV